MKIVVIKSPKFLSGILRTLFGIKKQTDRYIKKNLKRKGLPHYSRGSPILFFKQAHKQLNKEQAAA